MNFKNHILYRLSAKLLITASLLCVCFGNGIHVHTVFDQFSDHGDIHVYVHAHTADANHDHELELDENNDHQHPTATVDLNGTLSQNTVKTVFADENIYSEVGVISSVYSMKEVNPLYMNLPPPDFIIVSEYFNSLSLRGPPLG